MGKLSYKTRGNANSQGKPRVYFTCHPDDLTVFLERISEEILGISNCAIYYFANESDLPSDEEEYTAMLGQMQLFVMPVTNRLLTLPNRAVDRELAFALAHHIPVLPLMLEPGLDELFVGKFGDLQYLDKTCRDATAIRYEEKLRKYLEAVLIGDSLAQQVRDAFDAYIFLSYRKKDRKYAQELMRLIHRNDFCRDIAIWYDEFITPGRDFKETIQAALEKSDLFALAVTPNLLEDGNYVLTQEYPMAQVLQKQILPAEMIPTDRKELSEKYQQLAAPVDAHDAEAFTAALMKRLEQIAVRENDGDPQHNFFIGLAYLSGIDVEVDHERAVALIKGSAEAGLLEAMNKLAQMYHNGEGVARSYQEEAYWLERLAKQAEERFVQTQAEEDGHFYISRLWDLGDAWYALRQIAKAKEAYERMLTVGVQMNETFHTPSTIRNLLAGYINLGNISREEGKLAEAKAYYEKGLAMQERLAQEAKTVVAYSDLTAIYINLGNSSQAQGKPSEARAYYEKGLAIDELLAEQTGTVEAYRSLSVDYNNLGNICKEEGKLSEAKDYYEKGLAIDERLVRETQAAEAYLDLALDYTNLGNISRAEGKLADAEAYYEKGLAIRERLARETGTVKANLSLFTGYINLGMISQETEDYAKARAYYEKGFAIGKGLADQSETVEVQRNLSLGYCKLGDISCTEGDLAAAKTYYEKGFAIRERLARETGTVEANRDLSIAYDNLGDVSQAEGDLANAKAYYEKGLAIRERLVGETETVEALRDLSVSYNKLGMVSRERGDLATAKAYFKKELEIDERLARETGTVEALRDLSLGYINLGMIGQAEGDLATAKKYYEKVLKIREHLASQLPTAESLSQLADCYHNLGIVCQEAEDHDSAKAYYEKGLAIREGLAAEVGAGEYFNDLATSYYNIGLCTNDAEMFQKAYEIWHNLVNEYPGVPLFCQYKKLAKKCISIARRSTKRRSWLARLFKRGDKD